MQKLLFVLIVSYIAYMSYNTISCARIKNYDPNKRIFLPLNENNPDIKKILFLTDVHLDILYDSNTSSQKDFFLRCKNSSDYLNQELLPYDYGRYNCNPSEVLLTTALKDMKKNFPDLDMIIIGGDLISHGLYDLHVSKDGSKEKNKELFKQTFNTILSRIRNTYPKIKILPVLGNNDFYEHYQTPDEDSLKEQIQFLKHLYFESDASNYFYSQEKENFNPNFNETIAKGMYYSYFNPDLNTHFIGLNSNMFSINNLKITEENSLQQLDFLEKELEKIKKKKGKVFIMMHIPPYPQYTENNTGFFYVEKFSKRFEEIVVKYREYIINTLCGHLHWSKVGVRNSLFGKNIDDANSIKRLSSNSRNNLSNRLRGPFIPVSAGESKNNVFNTSNYFSLVNFHGLTPLHFSNPAYSIIHFNTESHLIDNIEVHFADLQKTWDKDKNYEFSKNVEIDPNVLFDTIYHYKDDFLFSKFDDDDFYDFVNKRIDNLETFKIYQLFIAGYKKNPTDMEYEEYKMFLRNRGMMDFDTDFKYFKCAFKILYETELKHC